MKNPHAFPLHPEYYDEDCLGMTLRDYFAAKAMQSFLDEVGSESDQRFYKDIAIGAYQVADAMLKAREA
jgi:hypothetical protein